MLKKRSKIYIKISPERNEAVFSGISFEEFINYLSSPIENILLIKADYIGEKTRHNFEILEGRDSITKFALEEDIYNYGDFCFVDYSVSDSIDKLSEQQIAELLYMAHIRKPLAAPFFDSLQNRFAYLSHDDGFYCKLYNKDWKDTVIVLLNKIREHLETKCTSKLPLLSETIIKELYNLAAEGLFIDLNEFTNNSEMVKVNLYLVGEYTNMDDFYNTAVKAVDNASLKAYLICSNNEWRIMCS